MQMRKLVVGAALGAALAADAQAEVNHVPERLDEVRLIAPEAAARNHILVANVAGAVPEAAWKLASTYAVSRLQVNVWTNAVASLDVKACVAERDWLSRAFGAKAKVGVFVVNDPKLPRLVGAPGEWIAVNVDGLAADGPNPQVLRDRYAKAILRGLAFACGSGSSLERDSLCYAAWTVEGLDRSLIQINPPTYFPMLERLRSVGGNEILTPAIAE